MKKELLFFVEKCIFLFRAKIVLYLNMA